MSRNAPDGRRILHVAFSNAHTWNLLEIETVGAGLSVRQALPETADIPLGGWAFEDRGETESCCPLKAKFWVQFPAIPLAVVVGRSCDKVLRRKQLSEFKSHAPPSRRCRCLKKDRGLQGVALPGNNLRGPRSLFTEGGGGDDPVQAD